MLAERDQQTKEIHSINDALFWWKLARELARYYGFTPHRNFARKFLEICSLSHIRIQFINLLPYEFGGPYGRKGVMELEQKLGDNLMGFLLVCSWGAEQLEHAKEWLQWFQTINKPTVWLDRVGIGNSFGQRKEKGFTEPHFQKSTSPLLP